MLRRVAVARSVVPTSGLQRWFDAHAPGTLWQDSAASSLVTAHGQSVGAWTDRVSGSNAVQATADKRPLYHTNVRNGRPGLLLDGQNDWMTLPALTSFTVTTGVSAFGVWQPMDHAPVGDAMMLTLTYQDDPQWVLELFYSVPAVDDHYYAVGYKANDASIATRFGSEVSALGAHVFGAVVTVGGNIVSYQDGAVTTGSAVPDLGCPYTSNWAILGANIGGQSRWMYGYVHEWLLWNRPLAAGEIDTVQTYLSQKWDITMV